MHLCMNNVGQCKRFKILILQGYLVSSTVDYLSQDTSFQNYIWILMTIGWVGPTCAMIYAHGSILHTNRYNGLDLLVQ